MSIRVVVVDDQDLVRTGLVMIVNAHPDFEVVGEAADGLAAIELVTRLRPDVLLIDIRMPGLDGVEVTRRLAGPGVAVIAFGSIDFSLDLGCVHERQALLAARSEIVWRSRAARRAAPIDGVTTGLSNLGMTEDDARHSAMLGFVGKMAIHPKQIGPIGRAFRPGEEEIAWAHRILGAATDGEAIQIEGEMVDRPVIERARRILSRVGATAAAS